MQTPFPYHRGLFLDGTTKKTHNAIFIRAYNVLLGSAKYIARREYLLPDFNSDATRTERDVKSVRIENVKLRRPYIRIYKTVK